MYNTNWFRFCLLVAPFLSSACLAVCAMMSTNPDASDADAAGGPRPKRIYDAETKVLNDFYRQVTPDQRLLYNKIRGTTSKKLFRAEYMSRKLTNVTGQQVSKQTDKKSDVSEGWYCNWPMLVKSQGGQIDLEYAMCCAANIAADCEARGPPYVLYNKQSKVLEWLKVAMGVKDASSTFS